MLVMTYVFGIIYSGFDTAIVTIANHSRYKRQADIMMHHIAYTEQTWLQNVSFAQLVRKGTPKYHGQHFQFIITIPYLVGVLRYRVVFRQSFSGFQEQKTIEHQQTVDTRALALWIVPVYLDDTYSLINSHYNLNLQYNFNISQFFLLVLTNTHPSPFCLFQTLARVTTIKKSNWKSGGVSRGNEAR